MITAVIEHLPLSCRLGEQGQSGGGLRCPKGYGRVQIRSACKSCNEGWYLTGKALLGQEIEGERPPWQGQRKWEPWPDHLLRAPFLTYPLLLLPKWIWRCSLPPPLSPTGHTLTEQLSISSIRCICLHDYFSFSYVPAISTEVIALKHSTWYFSKNDSKQKIACAHTHTQNRTFKEISLAFLKRRRGLWLWILWEAWVS